MCSLLQGLEKIDQGATRLLLKHWSIAVWVVSIEALIIFAVEHCCVSWRTFITVSNARYLTHRTLVLGVNEAERLCIWSYSMLPVWRICLSNFLSCCNVCYDWACCSTLQKVQASHYAKLARVTCFLKNMCGQTHGSLSLPGFHGRWVCGGF